MDGYVEEVLAPTLGAFAITGICCDVEDQGRIENAFPTCAQHQSRHRG
jgi:hypothetical protein